MLDYLNLAQVYFIPLSIQKNKPRQALQQPLHHMDFFFGCCKSVQSKNGYIRTTKGSNSTPKFINSLKDISAKQLASQSYQITQIQKSDYEDLLKQYSGTDKKWTDIQFPPDEPSMGKIPGVTTNKWKRISDLLNKPALFDGKIEPKDVVQGSLDDCYFLSALAALAEREDNIRAVFKDQGYNPNGIYKVLLRVDGEIKEILVDDFIPVNNNGEPLFSQPNKNQFWVLLLEKAWAKVKGSYANIVAGNPGQIFKAVSCAPVQTHLIKDKDNEKLWRTILAHTQRKYPCTCNTYENDQIDWQALGLLENHSYSLINAVELASSARSYRMVQLRNPWGQVEWLGEGSEGDQGFWKGIPNSQEKEQFLRRNQRASDGVFCMTFEDFCKYFSQLHFCMIEEHPNYFSENLSLNGKNGSVFTLEVVTPGLYFFQLHQSSRKDNKLQQVQEEQACRSTMLLARSIENGRDYEFIDGVLKYNDRDTTLKANLTQGHYILYTKLDPSLAKNLLPQKSSLSIYSSTLPILSLSTQQSHPQFLKKLFLNHAKLNKRQAYNNGLMWIAWKLLYLQGGYAYIAFGNQSESKKKFVITFDQKQEQFTNMKFKLKKNYKRKGDKQVLHIMPGEQQIILARVSNTQIESLKFPPEISIKLENIQSESNGQSIISRMMM